MFPSVRETRKNQKWSSSVAAIGGQITLATKLFSWRYIAIPHEWIAATYASQFAAVASNERAGRIAICLRAHSGLIQACAKRVVVEQHGKRREVDDVTIPSEFWWAQGQSALKQDWESGDFSTWIDGTARWQAFGVSFDFSTLIELVPASARAKGMAAISIAGNPDWLAARFADSAAQISGHYIPVTSKKAIIELCRTGHIVARALRMEKRSKGWDGEPGTVAVEWDVPLWFWRNFTGPDSSAQQWDIGTFSGYGRCAECDGYVKLIGVHFLKESLAPVLGPPVAPAPMEAIVEKPKGGPGRRNKYDWEGALLHLIGLAELDSIAPDPDAHGAQSDVAQLMADWFAANGGEVPESSQLRTYAKRALTAIKQRSANK